MYIVRESTNFVDLPNGRFDVGTFFVEMMFFKSPKELLLEGSKWCEETAKEYVDEMIFEDIKDANEKALEMTIRKLLDVKDGGKN